MVSLTGFCERKGFGAFAFQAERGTMSTSAAFTSQRLSLPVRSTAVTAAAASWYAPCCTGTMAERASRVRMISCHCGPYLQYTTHLNASPGCGCSQLIRVLSPDRSILKEGCAGATL